MDTSVNSLLLLMFSKISWHKYNPISYNNNNTTKWLLHSVKVGRIIGTQSKHYTHSLSKVMLLHELAYSACDHARTKCQRFVKKQAKLSQSSWVTVCVIDAKKVSAFKLGRAICF